MFKAVIATLVLLVAMAASNLDCFTPNNLVLPACTRKCITNRMVGDVCADDFGSFCDHPDYVNMFSRNFGSCLVTDCVSDQDIYDTLTTMYDECTHPDVWPLKVDGSLNDWFSYVFSSMISTATQKATETTLSSKSSSTDAVTTTKKSSNVVSSPTSAATTPSPPTSDSPPPPQQSSQSDDGPPAATPANPTDTTVSTDQGQPVTAPAAAPNTDQPGPTSRQAGTETTHLHAHPTTTFGSNNSTSTATDQPAFSTAAIAGTAAGGAVGLALIVGLTYFLMRRRKRRAFKPSPADMWDPTHNTDRKPTLPVLQDDINYSRYGEGVTQPQMNKAELHSNALLPGPQPTPLHSAYKSPKPGYPREGGNAGGGRYYQPPPQNQHRGNFNTRYPELPTHPHPSQPMSSPTSPISAMSTPPIWNASSTPTFRLSNPDSRSDDVRSPVSELGASEPLQSTRSAELSGEELRASNGATPPVELHEESLAPAKVEHRMSGGGVVPGTVEMGEGKAKGKAGISMDF